jgi:hypothetical protein
MEILLKDGSTYQLSDEDYIFFQNHYPDVDIDKELREMSAWCYANPQKRKTHRGAKTFINAWLCRSNKRKPLQATTGRTRDRSIEDDLRDHSWAT